MVVTCELSFVFNLNVHIFFSFMEVFIYFFGVLKFLLMLLNKGKIVYMYLIFGMLVQNLLVVLQKRSDLDDTC